MHIHFRWTTILLVKINLKRLTWRFASRVWPVLLAWRRGFLGKVLLWTFWTETSPVLVLVSRVRPHWWGSPPRGRGSRGVLSVDIGLTGGWPRSTWGKSLLQTHILIKMRWNHPLVKFWRRLWLHSSLSLEAILVFFPLFGQRSFLKFHPIYLCTMTFFLGWSKYVSSIYLKKYQIILTFAIKQNIAPIISLKISVILRKTGKEVK